MLALLTITVLAILVGQMTTATSVSSARLRGRMIERRCRRALDSVPGMAVRMLTERTEDLRIDTLGDDWAKPMFFDVGDIRVEIRIEDCQRRYDLTGLLEEEHEAIETEKAAFTNFAVECGVSLDVAAHLAETIALEAEARRLEDMTTTTTPEAETDADDDAPGAATTESAVPIWLEDFLSLPQLTETDRRDILLARVTREDPETFETYGVRFLDQITIWRTGNPNVNTATREVLLHELLNLSDPERVVDEILEKRAEEPFTSKAQISNLETLTRDEGRQVARYVQLRSNRFRVTATATPLDGKTPAGMRQATMVLILQRQGTTFTTLWRTVNV